MITAFFSPADPEDMMLHGLAPAGPAEVQGMLLDCGGFPVVALGYEGVVKGRLHVIDADDRDAVLHLLDLHHDVMPSGIRRSIVTVGDVQAWCYHWTGLMDRPVVPNGDWASYRGPRLL